MIAKDDSELPANLPVEDAAKLLGWSVPLLAEAVREGSVFCRTVAPDGWTGTRVSIGVANELGGPDNDCFVASREEGYRPNPGSLWCLPPVEAYPIVRDGHGKIKWLCGWPHRSAKYRNGSFYLDEPVVLARTQVLVVRQTLPVPSDRRPFPVEPGEPALEEKPSPKPKKRATERRTEHERWRAWADKIQQERKRDGKKPLNKYSLALEVIDRLQLSVSPETVRKRI